MARSKQEYDYFFKVQVPNEFNKKWALNFDVAKIAVDGDGLPEKVYHVWGDSIEDLICDCPAAYHHAQNVDKHVTWVRRWLAILEDQKTKSNYRLTPIYYNAETDAFYPLPSSHLEDTMEDI